MISETHLGRELGQPWSGCMGAATLAVSCYAGENWTALTASRSMTTRSHPIQFPSSQEWESGDEHNPGRPRGRGRPGMLGTSGKLATGEPPMRNRVLGSQPHAHRYSFSHGVSLR